MGLFTYSLRPTVQRLDSLKILNVSGDCCLSLYSILHSMISVPEDHANGSTWKYINMNQTDLFQPSFFFLVLSEVPQRADTTDLIVVHSFCVLCL